MISWFRKLSAFYIAEIKSLTLPPCQPSPSSSTDIFCDLLCGMLPWLPAYGVNTLTCRHLPGTTESRPYNIQSGNSTSQHLRVSCSLVGSFNFTPAAGQLLSVRELQLHSSCGSAALGGREFQLHTSCGSAALWGSGASTSHQLRVSCSLVGSFNFTPAAGQLPAVYLIKFFLLDLLQLSLTHLAAFGSPIAPPHFSCSCCHSSSHQLFLSIQQYNPQTSCFSAIRPACTSCNFTNEHLFIFWSTQSQPDVIYSSYVH